MTITDRVPPKIHIREEDRPKHKEPPINTVIFICPTPGCRNYYAAPNFQPGDPTLEVVQEKRGEHGLESTRTRRECPDCWLRDKKRVPRVPYVVASVVLYDDLQAAQARITERVEKAETEVVGDSSP